ncbi:MAG: PBP1A family penicillin-binding protein [Holophagales bacterium]|nr:PBP1A family penicillin-binding protein [Holophagales bacterium]MBK9968212.1 PBP1A family penicillin-binding protein [Holophagales bacterium]
MIGRRAAAILVLLLPVLLAAGLGIGAGWAVSQLIRVPKVEQLASYRPDIVTELRGTDGTIVARFAIERRFLVTRAQIPDVLVKAVLAAEDARFYDHGGVDIIRIGGAALRDLATRRLEQGASTITQQLAKLVFLTPEKSFARKINEVFLTVEIEKRYSKDQILTMYLNQVYLGHGNYGVEAASKWYFDRPAKELTLPQAALLAGLIQRPEAFSPMRNPSAAKARRDLVLRRMLEEQYIDARTAAATREAPLGLSRSAREATIGPYFCEEVRQYLEKTYGDRGLYRQGLRVDSTLDPRLQTWAEEELRRGLRRHERRFGFRKPRNLADDGIDPEKYDDPEWEEPNAAGAEPSAVRAVVLSAGRTGAELRVRDRRFTLPAKAFRFTRAESPASAVRRGDLVLVERVTDEGGREETIVTQEPVVEGAVVILENGTGAVRALVGGYDFSRSKFNRAVQALRQVGSAFKPIVYMTAVEEGFTPADTVLDSPISISIDPRQAPWRPQNYTRKFGGILTYQYALENSINVPAVRVDLLVGTRRVIETARRLGIRQHLLAYPSLALGSFEVSPIEMAAAYSVFANQGLLYEPRLVERVRDAEGVLLEENLPDPKEAAAPAPSYVLLKMLEGVPERGTAARAKALGLRIAGKTGTTNDHTDAWFIGVTPKHTIAVWVGHDAKKSIGPKSTGGDTALPIWMGIVARMKEAGIVKPSDDFDVPQGVVFVPFDLATGYRATPSCAKIVLGAFANGTQPTETCGDRPHAVSTLPHYLQKAVYAPKRGESSGADVKVDDAPRPAPGVPPPPMPATSAGSGPPD